MLSGAKEVPPNELVRCRRHTADGSHRLAREHSRLRPRHLRRCRRPHLLRVAIALAQPLAKAAPLLQPDAYAQALWMAAVFVLLGILIIIATKYIYETTLLSLDVLDPLVGGLLGVVSGIVVSHLFLRVLLTAYASTDFGTLVLHSFVGQEFIVFRSYHYVLTALQNLGNW